MAVQNLAELLQTLTSSLNTLSSTLPDTETLKPPKDGISLLDTKNELLLSYLQNLVFLILVKLRDARAQLDDTNDDAGKEKNRATAAAVVSKLVELRVYLERGVKPLESKLKYQIDKAVRSANDHEARKSQQRTKDTNGSSNGKKSMKIKANSEYSSDDSDDSNSDGEDSEVSDDGSEVVESSGANLSSFARPSQMRDRKRGTDGEKTGNGVYRPPRIAAVAPPTSESNTRQPRRPTKSHLLDEYVSSELSGAPVAEPSIGANIVDRGRGDIMSTRERQEAANRQRYEEENLVRLPGMGKKDKWKMKAEREKRGQFGGEEWSGLGGSAERIVQLTRRGTGTGGARNALERSRKRGRDTQTDGRGDGGGAIGERFERKRRQLENRANRRRQ